jgi:hypothetical protein
LSLPTLPQQALLYRLCGGRNTLHSDPGFASAAGFPKPILHGLCSYGIGCKAMVDALLDGDTSRVGSYGARFADVVFPGEALKVSIWKDGDGFQAVVTAPERDDAVALCRCGVDARLACTAVPPDLLELESPTQRGLVAHQRVRRRQRAARSGFFRNRALPVRLSAVRPVCKIRRGSPEEGLKPFPHLS